ncbi:MAG: tetratricopeptide repeat protein [Pseudomonadota bacterium]
MRIATYTLVSSVICFTCFFPLSALAEPVLTIDADRQFEFAESYFRAGEYYKAIGEYERFVHFFPEDVRVEAAMYNIGLSYFNGEKFQEAIDAFNALPARFPSTDFRTEAQFKISECLVRIKDRLQAIGYLNDIAATTEYKDVSDEAYYRRGWIYLEMDQWEEAEESFALISPKNRDNYRLKTLSREMSKKKDLRTKSPTTAGLLSIIPGAGHAYCGRYKDATVAFVLNSAMIYAAYEAFDEDHDVLGGIITFFEFGFYTGNIYSAVNCAHKFNKGVKNRFLDYLRDNSRVKVGLNSDQTKKPALMLSYQINF